MPFTDQPSEQTGSGGGRMIQMETIRVDREHEKSRLNKYRQAIVRKEKSDGTGKDIRRRSGTAD